MSSFESPKHIAVLNKVDIGLMLPVIVLYCRSAIGTLHTHTYVATGVTAKLVLSHCWQKVATILI